MEDSHSLFLTWTHRVRQPYRSNPSSYKNRRVRRPESCPVELPGQRACIFPLLSQGLCDQSTFDQEDLTDQTAREISQVARSDAGSPHHIYSVGRKHVPNPPSPVSM